jgi:hypothetical protein
VDDKIADRNVLLDFNLFLLIQLIFNFFRNVLVELFEQNIQRCLILDQLSAIADDEFECVEAWLAANEFG